MSCAGGPAGFALPMRARNMTWVWAMALAFLAAPSGRASDFGHRFDEIVAGATPAQLYAFLYDMPKGGDLHNHAAGSNRAEWMYAICTDPARNGGETFYTRTHFSGASDSVDPRALFQTIRRKTYDMLPGPAKAQFVPLASLTPAERVGWCASTRLDGAGDGRLEFFSRIWPRLAQLNQCLPLATELLVENMKAFGAEHLAYVETQFVLDGMVDNDGNAIPDEAGGAFVNRRLFIPDAAAAEGATQFVLDGMVDNDGNAIPDEAAVAFVKRRLSMPDAASTGVTIRFQATILRFSPDAEMRLAKAYAFVDAHRDLWVGLNK